MEKKPDDLVGFLSSLEDGDRITLTVLEPGVVSLAILALSKHGTRPDSQVRAAMAFIRKADANPSPAICCCCNRRFGRELPAAFGVAEQTEGRVGGALVGAVCWGCYEGRPDWQDTMEAWFRALLTGEELPVLPNVPDAGHG